MARILESPEGKISFIFEIIQPHDPRSTVPDLVSVVGSELLLFFRISCFFLLFYPPEFREEVFVCFIYLLGPYWGNPLLLW